MVIRLVNVNSRFNVKSRCVKSRFHCISVCFVINQYFNPFLQLQIQCNIDFIDFLAKKHISKINTIIKHNKTTYLSILIFQVTTTTWACRPRPRPWPWSTWPWASHWCSCTSTPQANWSPNWSNWLLITWPAKGVTIACGRRENFSPNTRHHLLKAKDNRGTWKTTVSSSPMEVI